MQQIDSDHSLLAQLMHVDVHVDVHGMLHGQVSHLCRNEGTRCPCVSGSLLGGEKVGEGWERVGRGLGEGGRGLGEGWQREVGDGVHSATPSEKHSGSSIVPTSPLTCLRGCHTSTPPQFYRSIPHCRLRCLSPKRDSSLASLESWKPSELL